MTDIRGFVERLTHNHVHGWAYDASNPSRPPLIEVVIDGRPVAVGQTDQVRPDLAGLGIGRDNLGFSISLPEGTSVDIGALQVRAAGDNRPLTVTDTAGAYEGVVEVFEGGALKGWAWRCGFPIERVRVVVRHKGDVVGSSLANQLRPDLAGAGIGDGRHAFLIALPVATKQLDPEHLFAEFEATGEPLNDLRYPGRVPPPRPVVAPSPQTSAAPSSPAPTPVKQPIRPVTPLKTPIAARPPMTRMPGARPIAAAPRPTSAPAASASKRPISSRTPTPPPVVQSPAPPPMPRATPAARPPISAPAPARVAPPPPQAAPAPQQSAPAPANAAPPPPAPAPAPPAVQPSPTISKELYEALRESMGFGDEGGLF